MKFTCMLVSVCALMTVLAFAQTDYSFTISGAQTWTDTGVDLNPGDDLTFSVIPKTGSNPDCDPSGSSNAAADKLPLPVAAAGSVIAKTSENGGPTLIGHEGKLRADSAGHLFIGLNQSSQSSCAFVVKVQITHQPSSQTQVAAASSSSGETAQRPALKEQLSSAAQVWLKGQFGNSNSSSNSGTSNAVAGSSASSATASASSGLKIPTVVLDADLRQHIDDLPRRIHDHAGNLGDMVNFVMIGSQEKMQAALDASDWHVADVDSKEAGLKAILDTYQKKEYLQMPMSHLYLFDRMQDFGYEQAQAFAVVASRHHFRIWKAPFAWNNQVVWVGAATHDIGFEKDIRTGKLTHKIDPDIDAERQNLAQGLEKSAKTTGITYYLPPNPIQEAKNASGGGYHSDGRLLVVFLK